MLLDCGNHNWINGLHDAGIPFGCGMQSVVLVQFGPTGHPLEKKRNQKNPVLGLRFADKCRQRPGCIPDRDWAASACRPGSPGCSCPVSRSIRRSRLLSSRPGSKPRRPSLAPVSRMTISGCKLATTQSMRESAPLLVSPAYPGVHHPEMVPVGCKATLQLGRIRHFLVNAQPGGQAVAHRNDGALVDRRRGFDFGRRRFCRRLLTASSHQQAQARSSADRSFFLSF